MGKLIEKAIRVATQTETGRNVIDRGLSKAVSTDAYKTASNAVVFALSDAWVGISLFKPAKTSDGDNRFNTPDWIKQRMGSSTYDSIKTEPRDLNRWYYDKMYYMQIGDYLMPMSQTFSLRAKKKLNISSLVDGVDIIQQTRKEAKTIDVTLRVGIDTKIQPNLQIVRQDLNSTNSIDRMKSDIAELSQFLSEFYEDDTILRIYNDKINNTFGVTYVIMQDYKFTPRTGMGTFTFEFTLVEVEYGENVLTFNLRDLDSDAGTRRQITD